MLHRAGGRGGRADPLFDDAVRFVADRLLADGPHLKPAYTTYGAACLTSAPCNCRAIPVDRRRR